MHKNNNVNYFRQKYEMLKETVYMVEEFEKKVPVFLDEDRKKYQSLTENNSELLFGKSDYAIEYYPPRVIIGKE